MTNVGMDGVPASAGATRLVAIVFTLFRLASQVVGSPSVERTRIVLSPECARAKSVRYVYVACRAGCVGALGEASYVLRAVAVSLLEGAGSSGLEWPSAPGSRFSDRGLKLPPPPPHPP